MTRLAWGLGLGVAVAAFAALRIDWQPEDPLGERLTELEAKRETAPSPLRSPDRARPARDLAARDGLVGERDPLAPDASRTTDAERGLGPDAAESPAAPGDPDAAGRSPGSPDPPSNATLPAQRPQSRTSPDLSPDSSPATETPRGESPRTDSQRPTNARPESRPVTPRAPTRRPPPTARSFQGDDAPGDRSPRTTSQTASQTASRTATRLASQPSGGAPADATTGALPSAVDPSAATELDQGDWARCMVDVMGLDAGLPKNPTVDDYIDLLNGRPKQPVPLGAARGAARLVEPQAEPRRERFDVEVPASGMYQLRVDAQGGASRWTIDGQDRVVLTAGDSLSRLESDRLSLLSRGKHRIEAEIGAGVEIARAELVPLDTPAVRPPGGWNPNRPLTQGDRALTMVQALGVESDLPPAERLVVEAEIDGPKTAQGARFQSETSVVARTRVPESGTYSIFVRGQGVDGTAWSIDDGVKRAVPRGGRVEGSGWKPLGNARLEQGTHELRGETPTSTRIEAVRLVRRVEDPNAATQLLSGLGFDLVSNDQTVWAAEAGAQACRRHVPISRIATVSNAAKVLAVAGFSWQAARIIEDLVEEESTDAAVSSSPPPDLSPSN